MLQLGFSYSDGNCVFDGESSVGIGALINVPVELSAADHAGESDGVVSHVVVSGEAHGDPSGAIVGAVGGGVHGEVVAVSVVDPGAEEGAVLGLDAGVDNDVLAFHDGAEAALGVAATLVHVVLGWLGGGRHGGEAEGDEGEGLHDSVLLLFEKLTIKTCLAGDFIAGDVRDITLCIA